METLTTKKLFPNLEIIRTIRFEHQYPSFFRGHLAYKRIKSPGFNYAHPQGDILDIQLLTSLRKCFPLSNFNHCDLLTFEEQESNILAQIRGGFEHNIDIYFTPSLSEDYFNKAFPFFSLRMIIQSSDHTIKTYLPNMITISDIPMIDAKTYINSIVKI